MIFYLSFATTICLSFYLGIKWEREVLAPMRRERGSDR